MNEFTTPALNAYGQAQVEELERVFKFALNDVCAIIPAGRERALVTTKLQEAFYFAKQGVFLNKDWVM